MPSLNLNTILIVEPKPELAAPYTFLPQDTTAIHLQSTQKAFQYLNDIIPDLVLISTSFSPTKILHLLEIIKEKSGKRQFLIPIIMVVDLDHQTNFIPGTNWGGKIGILSSHSSRQELDLSINRICKPQPSYGYDACADVMVVNE